MYLIVVIKQILKELPENPNLISPIIFQIFSKPKHIPIGMCAPQPANSFFVSIPEIESNESKNEHPVHSGNEFLIFNFNYNF